MSMRIFTSTISDRTKTKAADLPLKIELLSIRLVAGVFKAARLVVISPSLNLSPCMTLAIW